MLGETQKQFSLTRVAPSTTGRAESKFYHLFGELHIASFYKTSPINLIGGRLIWRGGGRRRYRPLAVGTWKALWWMALGASLQLPFIERQSEAFGSEGIPAQVGRLFTEGAAGAGGNGARIVNSAVAAPASAQPGLEGGAVRDSAQEGRDQETGALLKAALEGEAAAQYRLGMLYADGRG
jgi:hypothetical protein